MKIQKKLILLLLFCLMLASCATTGNAAVQDIHKEKKQAQKKLLFEDWKYKGFGQELPVWFEAAYKNDISAIKKAIPQLSDLEIVIIRGEGINSDQADRNMELAAAEAEGEYELYDFSWGMTGEEQYIALAIYTKE